MMVSPLVLGCMFAAMLDAPWPWYLAIIGAWLYDNYCVPTEEGGE